MPHLYSLTLQKATAICEAIQGSFSQPKTTEIVVSKGKILELLRPTKDGKLQVVCSTEVFGLIRTISTFRLHGSQRDHVVVGSDSGRIVILEHNDKTSCFERVHLETYGKTGVRRIVPGQYLATDPKGRAIMIGAVEKQKFVYVLNRDASSRLSISSPLEAHKSHNICFALTGLDVGFENPIFASIEQHYDEPDRDPRSELPKKGLALWEMDLGLNHVTKTATMPIDHTAHALIPVPAGTQNSEAPSGVIVCCENFLVYKKPDHEDVVCALPRRLEMGKDRGMIVVAHAAHRARDLFFFLIQTEYGDLYKVFMKHQKGVVTELMCSYFDTIPVVNSMCVLKSGFLFVASEFGNHYCYRFLSLGDNANDPQCTSLHKLGKDAIVAFKPTKLKYLTLVDEIASLSPITDMKLVEDSTGTGLLVTLCGRGPRSSLRVLQEGIQVSQRADNMLKGTPTAVWSLKDSQNSTYDAFSLVAFAESTLVLSIGATVQEVSETNFLVDVQSLHVALLGDDSMLQVHDKGYRHIRKNRKDDWKSPNGKRVKTAASNESQLVLALTDGELLYFELDESGTLVETELKKHMGQEVSCVSVQPVPEGRSRASFVAVGGLDNMRRPTVWILSMERDRGMRQLSMAVLPKETQPESVCLVAITGVGYSDESSTTLFLNVGLDKGILVTAVVDLLTGQLSDQRSRFLGARAVTLFKVPLGKNWGMYALCMKPWLMFPHQGKCMLSPLKTDTLSYIASFQTEQCPDGYAAICGSSLKIFQCLRMGETFHQSILPLNYTPRKVTVLEPPSLIMGATQSWPLVVAVVQADHNSFDEETKRDIRDALRKIRLDQPEGDEDEEEKDKPDTEECDESGLYDPQEEQIGTFKAGPGKWGSCISIVNCSEDPPRLLHRLEMEVDEAVLSCCVCGFAELEIPCLVVGTVYKMNLAPRTVESASIKVYAYDTTCALTLLHSTKVEDYPVALCPWNGRLLASIGNKVRLYALGHKKLLRKCEYRNIPDTVMWLRTSAERIFAGDIRESVHVLKYRQMENAFHVLADDTAPRWMVAGEVLDHHTIVGSDKFDSIFVTRVPTAALADEGGDFAGLKLKGDTGYLTGQCHKLEGIAHFHLGETVTALQKGKLHPGGYESILHASIMGSIGTMLPLVSKDEVDMLQCLEMILRTESPPLCGREHIMFRSYYNPVKAVIDGDLCEQFSSLALSKQREIAADMKRSPEEINRKLEDLRNRVL
eukprot:GHVN01001572.1.p1 GENE.GHVN01001572.1~~GHVN01001572.1.p1  ORF type:complete len:1229 (+),score=96.51 GHVN01001572.1:8231-11917(+)